MYPHCFSFWRYFLFIGHVHDSYVYTTFDVIWSLYDVSSFYLQTKANIYIRVYSNTDVRTYWIKLTRDWHIYSLKNIKNNFCPRITKTNQHAFAWKIIILIWSSFLNFCNWKIDIFFENIGVYKWKQIETTVSKKHVY